MLLCGAGALAREPGAARPSALRRTSADTTGSLRVFGACGSRGRDARATRIDTWRLILQDDRSRSGEALPVAGRAETCAPPTFVTPAAKCSRRLPVDYFTFFGLPRKLNLDVARLEKEFYELSRKLHPDLNARADKREQEWSLEQSSLLNDAYRTLKDPIKRTQYLLRLEGVELEEQSKAATEKARASGEVKKQIVPPDLLEEVFELNMQLEELRMNKKMGEDDPALAKELETHKAQFEKKYEELSEELKSSLERVGSGR